MLCIYHRADLDGLCSAAIIKTVFPKDCRFIGVDYGEPLPVDSIVPGEDVFLVDFSYPMDEMVELNNMCKLTWVDHHKSAIEDSINVGFTASGAQRLVVGVAACELVWDMMYPDAPCEAVDLLGRYDVWDHSNPDVLPFQYGMRAHRCQPEDMDFWLPIFTGGIEGIIDDGKVILAYEEMQNEKYSRAMAFDMELDGLRGIAVNRALCNSLLFKEVYDPERHDVMVAFSRKGDFYKVSLYSDKPEVDCSAVCFARGGGGHKGAAGFKCKELPF